MKKLFFVLVSFAFNVSFSQIPSINETKSDIDIRYSKNKIQNTKIIQTSIDSLEVLRDKIFTEESVKDSTKKIDLLIEEFKTKTEQISQLNSKIKEAKNRTLTEAEIYTNAYDKKILGLYKEKSDLEIKQSIQTNTIEKIESYSLKIKGKNTEIENLIDERNKKLKSLTYSWFLPTINKEKRADFFKLTYNNIIEKTNYVNSFSVQGNEDGFLAQSEIITDNLNAFRVSFGTVINTKTTNKEEETSTTDQATKNSDIFQKDAVNRLVNGGGNLYIDLILPLITTYDGSASDYLTFYTYFNTRAAMDVKGFGNNIDTSTGNGSFGFNSYASISSDTKKFNFFAQGSVNYNFGSNDFYKNLGIKNEQGFLNGKVIVGVGLLNHFKVTAIVNTFGSDEKLRSGKVSIGIQVLPGN